MSISNVGSQVQMCRTTGYQITEYNNNFRMDQCFEIWLKSWNITRNLLSSLYSINIVAFHIGVTGLKVTLGRIHGLYFDCVERLIENPCPQRHRFEHTEKCCG